MTREQQRQAKAEKLAKKQQAREEKMVSRMEEKAWDKMVWRAKIKGAWIEEVDETEVAEGRAERDREIQREVELDNKVH